MIDVEERVLVQAGPGRIWQLLSDFEGCWEESNPAHRGTEVLTSPKQPIRDGLRWWQREKVGPITGEMVAEVHDTIPEQGFSWTARATYRLLGIPVHIRQGGTVTLDPRQETTELRHRVWGRFPATWWGRALEWLMVRLCREDKAAARHTRVELEYFKSLAEQRHEED